MKLPVNQVDGVTAKVIPVICAQTGAPDDAYEKLQAHFSSEEMAKITVAIGAINVWNRPAVSFRAQHPLDKVAKAA